MAEIKYSAFETIKKLYKNYGARAKQLKDNGENIIGYVCSFVPLEIIYASGSIPFRIKGDINEPVTKADPILEPIVCPYYRSCFDVSLKGRYDFLSGMIIPHACDSMVRSYSVWSYSLSYPYFHFLNVPTVCEESSFEFFNSELKTFIKSLEDFLKIKITNENLINAIKVYNKNRSKVRQLYELRKSSPPLISGTEILMALIVGGSLPVEESNKLFEDLLMEIKNRNTPPVQKGPRILIDGPCLDNIELIELVENLGGNVVADTICNGTRDYFPMTDEKRDPVDALARRYLDKLNCPKTYRANKAQTFEGDIANRFWDIGKYAKEFEVDGAILYLYKYCDPFGFEVPARKAYYNSINVPLLHIEDIYSSGTMGQLRTRVQAFLEMIG